MSVLSLVPEANSDQPSKRVFLRVPEDYFDLSEAEQDEVLGEMADATMAGLGMDDGESRKPVRFAIPKDATETELRQIVNRIRKQANLPPEDS